jgi:hypothetical protein
MVPARLFKLTEAPKTSRSAPELPAIATGTGRNALRDRMIRPTRQDVTLRYWGSV